MSGGEREAERELESQLEAAGLLVESLEREIAGLRHELAQATVALKAARAEVTARERALEETGHAPEDEVRRIKSVAETRERELRRTFARRLREAEEAFEKRLASLTEQREADRRAFLDRLEAQQKRNQHEMAVLDEELEGMRLRRETELRTYNERLRQLKEENLALRRALEEANREEAYRRGSHLETQPQKEKREEDFPDGTSKVQGRDLAERASPPHNSADPTHRLLAAVERFNASEHTLTAAATIKSFGLPDVLVEQENPDGPVSITFSWGELGWRRYICESLTTDESRVRLAAEGSDPIEIIPNARLDLEGRILLGERAR